MVLVLAPVEFAPAPPVGGVDDATAAATGGREAGAAGGHVWSAPPAGAPSASADAERYGDAAAVARLEQQLVLARSQVVCDVADSQMHAQYHTKKAMNGAHAGGVGMVHGSGGTPGLMYTTPGGTTPGTARRAAGAGAGAAPARNAAYVRAPMVSDSEEEEEEDDDEEDEEEDDDDDDDNDDDDGTRRRYSATNGRVASCRARSVRGSGALADAARCASAAANTGDDSDVG